MFNLLLSLFLFIFISSCSVDVLEYSLRSPQQISGQLISYSQSQEAANHSLSSPSAFVTSSVCNSPQVELYKLDTNGELIHPALSTVALNEDGSYSFSLKGLGIQFQNLRPITALIVSVSGCQSGRLQRPITGSKEQDISFGSSLLSQVLNTDKKDNLFLALTNEGLSNQLGSLILKLNEGASFDQAYTQLTTQSENQTLFNQVFASAPTDLTHSAPDIMELSWPDTALELSALSAGVSISHWSSAYVAAYQWTLDGVAIEHSANLSYTLHANSQGVHTLALTVGKNDGSGNVDLSLPTQVISKSITIDNNILPQAPSFLVTAPVLSSLNSLPTRDLSISLDTGLNLANCASFTALALTEDFIMPPLNPSAFNIACDTAPSHSIAYQLSSSEGAKTLALWAKDASGAVSVSPTAFNLIRDQTPPAISLTVSPIFKGGQASIIQFTLSDNLTGITQAELFYSEDNGLSFTKIDDIQASDSSYSWAVPLLNISSVKFKISATDGTGNQSIVISDSVTIDSLAPTLSITTPVGDGTVILASNIAHYTVGGVCSEEGVTVAIAGAVTSSAVCTGGFWTKDLDLTLFADGQLWVTATQVDLAGNSASTLARSFIKDSTAPSISITSPTILQGNSSNASLAWSLTEPNVASSSQFTIELSVDNGNTWSSVGTTSANEGANLNQDYLISSWAVPNIDTASAKLRATITDAAGNIQQQLSDAFIIDSTPPILSIVSINDGAIYAGTALVNVKVDLSDNNNLAGALGQKQVRLTLANAGTASCQSEYANNNWQPWIDSNTNIPFTFIPTDGIKKVCVWAKDGVGNISLIAPDMGTTGVDFDEIEYSTGNPPQITGFTVTNTVSGDFTATLNAPLTINWTATDIEGLDNNPITISYTTNNTTWLDIVTNQDISNLANKTWLSGLTGNPTSATGQITTFNAPSASYFKLKIQSRDIAGNTSSIVSSQAFNTGNWSIYAGTKDRGDGGTGKGAALFGSSQSAYFAINPKNGDIYASDAGVGIRKLDAKTGLVSTFIQSGTFNLPDNGDLPAAPKINSGSFTNLSFDSKGRLYIYNQVSGSSMSIYQIDLTTNKVRKYAGGGLLDDGDNPSTSLQIGGGYNFDEQDSLYVWTYCGGVIVPYGNTVTANRMVKIEQNSDGSPGATTRIIGDCTQSTAKINGATAYNHPALHSTYASLSTIIPGNSGEQILVLPFSCSYPYKIVNGLVYQASVSSCSSSGAGVFNTQDGHFYKASPSGIEKVILNTTGTNGDVATNSIVSSSTGLGCSHDGTDLSNFCGSIRTHFQMRQGVLYFADGGGVNQESNYQIRYFDGNNKLRTVLGSKPFYGDGLNISLIRGALAGIYYKKATESNQAAFPEGLYFTEKNGMVFGHIEPATKIASILWGNQAALASTPVSGTTISKDLNMGAPYFGGNGWPLTFDSNGLPWMRVASHVVSIDQDKKIIRRTNATINAMLQVAPDNADPRNYGMYVDSGQTNYALKNESLFVTPNYINLPGYDPIMTVRLMDFTNFVTPILIGGNYLFSSNQPPSADVTTQGQVKNAPLAAFCNRRNCYLNYNAQSDRLYFSENNKIRYITTPDNPATSTLTTLFSIASPSIYNFALTPDSKQIWYIRSSGGIYCYDISSGKSWCDNSTDYFSIRTSAGFSASAGPNQMTFKDNQTLFLSTYNGEILQFNLPAGE